MIDLYYWPTPNGHKITIFLEEAELDYSIIPVNIGAGEQFHPDFLKISPNNRMPAIIDKTPADGGAPISLFESGAILLYLAEKTCLKSATRRQRIYSRRIFDCRYGLLSLDRFLRTAAAEARRLSPSQAMV